MYDFYGGYPGVYAGGMLVQTYPGGPLVPAVPVPVPVQAVDWYGRGSASASSPGSPPQGELGFYYALGYPTAAVAADVSAPNETGASNSRRNSLESCQVSYSINPVAATDLTTGCCSLYVTSCYVTTRYYVT